MEGRPHPRVVHRRRETITALPLYHYGKLLKKNLKEKDFRNFYGELRGSTVFLYNNDTQDTYSERLDLGLIKSMDMESPYKNKGPNIFTLSLPLEEVQLKMDNPDTGEEWRGYIMTLVNCQEGGKNPSKIQKVKEIPSDLHMLPGQKMKLEEMLAQEKKRNPQLQRPALPPRPGFLQTKDTPDMPACFFDATRQEAEKLLSENPENGNIILRPSTMPKNYALTLRQKTDRGYVLKNYRVTSTTAGFVIELETPITVHSLNDVLKYFLEKTEYRLRPYVVAQPYDTRIVVAPPPKCVNMPPPVVPKAQVAPMQRSQAKDMHLPLIPRPDEGEYVLPEDPIMDDQMTKKAQVAGELQAVLQMRKENLYVEAGTDEDFAYQNEEGEKFKSKVRWTTNIPMP